MSMTCGLFQKEEDICQCICFLPNPRTKIILEQSGRADAFPVASTEYIIMCGICGVDVTSTLTWSPVMPDSPLCEDSSDEVEYSY